MLSVEHDGERPPPHSLIDFLPWYGYDKQIMKTMENLHWRSNDLHNVKMVVSF